MKAKWKGLMVLSVICILFTIAMYSASASSNIIKGPYLLYEGSNTSMSVLWQTSVNESNVIRWGTSTSYSMGQATVGTYGSSNQHKYTITGLQPGTKYYYEVGGKAASFRTAPANNATSVKFLAYGDSRSNPSIHEQVAARARSAYAADPAKQTLIFNSGDFVSTDTESNWTSQYFVSGSTYPQLNALQAEIPMIGARGNHEDSGSVYRKYFPYPYVANHYWSFDYGPVHFVVLDVYASFSSGSAQYNWLVNDLASTNKPWKIVMAHAPGWGAGTHANNSTIQNQIHPLLKQYGVQVYLNGHNHNYARAVVDGIQYVTSGGGGAPLYNTDASWPNIVKTDKSHHLVEFDIQGTNLTFTARRADGTVIEAVNVPQGGGGGGGSTTVTSQVNAGSNDAEERETGGTMYLTSSDLELVYDTATTGNQHVGMRFTNVNVPKGKVITNAYIQFTVDETSSGATNLTIRGQANSNPGTFTTAAYNVSSRPKTAASVSWSPPAWTTIDAAGADQRTPNLKAIVQEIVNRNNWAPGNAMVFFVNGTGKRVARAYESGAAKAPKLVITYQ